MAVWSSVNIGQLPNFRFDAEYYQPSYVELSAQLAKADPQAIGDFAYVTDGIHASPQWVEEGGMRYLSAKSVKDNEIILHTAGQISLEQHRANPRTEARINDVLLTTVGTIGNAAVVNEDVLPANMDRHLGIIRIYNPEHVDPYYLATFLNSKYGMFQSVRESTGNVQLNLFIDKIKKIQVPVGERFNQIGELTRQAYDLRRKSKMMLEAAENALLEDFSINLSELTYANTFTAHLNAVNSASRFDAEYFRPKYQQLLDAVRESASRHNWRVVNLGELSAPPRYGTSSKLEYLEAGIPFLRIADVSNLRFDPDNIMYISKESAEAESTASVEHGDVLISRSGTLGLSIAISEQLNRAIYGSYFIRIRPNRRIVNPWYLMLYLNSQIGQLQVERANTGGVQTNLTIPVISAIQIVLPPIYIQEQFATLLLDGFATLDEAKLLTKKSKLAVENLLEWEQ